MYFRTPRRARAQLQVVVAAVGMFSAALTFAPGASAQTDASQPNRRARVTGRVVDAATNQPLAAANIFIIGTPITATSTADGRFVITSAPPGIFTIEAKRLGYGAQRFENIRLIADSVRTLEFKLTDRPMMLDQVSVAGTVDAQSVAKSTFATSVVTAEQMPVPTTGSAAGMISGKVAGVNITRGSGRPGAGVNIQLRSPIGGIDQQNGASGNGSVPGPLFVVDGVYLNSSQQVTTQDIEGMDVASIEVIKGAAAAALYGARAAAGVIAITTNRGKNLALNETKFTFRSEYGADSYLTRLNKNDHHQFLQDAQGNWVNAAGQIVPRTQRVTKQSGIMDSPYTSPIYNNANQLFKTSTWLTNKADIAGNFSNSNYYVSYARTEQPGIVKYNEGFKRQSIKLNVDSRPTEKLSIGVSANHSRVFDDGSPVNFTDFYGFDADVNLQRPQALQAFGFPYAVVPDSAYNRINPLFAAFIADNVSRRARTQVNVNGSYRPVSWFSLSGDASYDRGDLQRIAYTPRGTPSVNATTGAVTLSTGRLDVETDITDGYVLKGNGSLTKSFGGLTVRVTEQGVVQRETNPLLITRGDDFQTEGVKAMSQARTKSVTDQHLYDTRIINNVVTLGLSYNEKYIGDFLVNREGNSRFGAANRWNTFGRASAAWLMHEEGWFPLKDQFQQFKLRYSWGIAGQSPGFDQQYEAFSSDGSGGITRTTLGNKNIVPTKSIESEFGFDFTFLNRFQGQLTYAKGETKDNFVAVPAPAVSGYCCVTSNPATTELKTYEATINASIINHPGGLVFNANLIMDQASNVMTKFGRTCFIDTMKWSCEGARIGVMIGHDMVHKKSDLLAKHANSQNAFDINDEGFVVAVGAGNTWRDGVAKNLWGTNVVIDGTSYPWGNPILARTETGLIKDFVMGDANPKLHFGLQPDIRYKNIRFNFLLDGKLGGNTYNNSDQGFYNSCDAEECDQFGRPDELKKPVTYYKAVANNNSDYQAFFAQSGTFARLAELIVGYTMDAKKYTFLRKAGVSKAQFDIIGRNLKYFTKYKGLNVDPGSSLQRIDDATYPLTRTWTGAVTLTF